MTGDDVEPWLKKIYDAQYEAWARKVDAADPGYKEAADGVERYFEEGTMSEMKSKLIHALDMLNYSRRAEWGNIRLERYIMREIVVEILATMREPTQAMVTDGVNAGLARAEDVPIIWRAMIDEALK